MKRTVKDQRIWKEKQPWEVSQGLPSPQVPRPPDLRRLERNSTLHSEGISKAASLLFRGSTLGNSKKGVSNVGQEKRTHQRPFSRCFSVNHALSLLLSLQWLKLMLSSRLDWEMQELTQEPTQKRVHFLNYLSTQDIKQSTKEHSLLKIAWFGEPGLKRKVHSFQCRTLNKDVNSPVSQALSRWSD